MLWSLDQLNTNQGFDISLFVTKSRKSPYFNMFEKENDYLKLSKNIGAINSRQSSPIVYDHVAGSYFILKHFLETKKYLNKSKVIGYEIKREESFDIDDILDFNICEKLYKK
jgi:CMP-N-acetylneuraminic acid synthetase